MADCYEKKQKMAILVLILILVLAAMGRHASVACFVETCYSTSLGGRPT